MQAMQVLFYLSCFKLLKEIVFSEQNNLVIIC